LLILAPASMVKTRVPVDIVSDDVLRATTRPEPDPLIVIAFVIVEGELVHVHEPAAIVIVSPFAADAYLVLKSETVPSELYIVARHVAGITSRINNRRLILV